VYEGEANNDDVHGGTQAAPMIGKVLNQLLKPEKKAKKVVKKKTDEEPAPEEKDADGTTVRRAAPVRAED
jgi:hypothetical protein